MNRIFYSDNGTLTDFSAALNDYHNLTSTIPQFTAQDAIYIGNSVPFNHIFFKLSTLNTLSSLINVSYWTNRGWSVAAEVIDETMTNGKSFSQSGFVTWSPSKDETWISSDTNYRNSIVTGLTSVTIYDLYWLKITFSANLSNDVTFNWVGQKFSDDDILGSEFPDLVRSAVMSAWESGKTSWEEQHVIAADIMAKDMISKGLILEKGQILDRFDLDKPSVQKVAEIIYGGLGADYVDKKLACRKEYEYRLNTALPKVDLNQNGRLDTNERTQTGKLYR